ncbi:MAG: hypothetical protein NTV86_04310 [Planctomycetota bacterium]|nr:hypothetical protein [Planctomycetota bacterium]
MKIGNLETMTPDCQAGPSWWWYLVGAGIAVAGAIFSVVFLVQRIMSVTDDMQQVVVPGEGRLTLSQPGHYMIFHEYQSVVGGKVYSNPRGVAGLECVLKASKTGRTVALAPVNMSAHYSLGGRAGVGIFQFDITEPGEYVLTGTISAPGTNAPAVLSVGGDFMKQLLVTIFGCMGGMFGGVILAVGVILLTFFKRRKARRAQQPLGIPPAMPRA